MILYSKEAEAIVPNIQDDVNFLRYPNWIISSKKKTFQLCIDTSNGSYEMKSPEGLPSRFDKVVLYFLLHKISGPTKVMTDTLYTTRYEIAKNVLFQEKNFSAAKYNRIMMALKKWKAIYIRYEGTFIDAHYPVIKIFSIIDSIVLNKQTNELSIKFNEHYIAQLNSPHYRRFIIFDEYKQLIRPVSARLYEMLAANLEWQEIWSVNIDQLGEMLTLAKRMYPSQILSAINPAVKEINQKTRISFRFDYDKAHDLCIFKKLPSLHLRAPGSKMLI